MMDYTLAFAVAFSIAFVVAAAHYFATLGLLGVIFRCQGAQVTLAADLPQTEI